MIEFLPAPDHVGAYRLSGTLTEEDYDRVNADVEARLARYDKIGLFADLTGFHDITVRAGIKDLRYSFGKMLKLSRFPREAVVTDKQWLKTAASVAGSFIPFIEVRAFDPADSEAGLLWVADFTPVSKQKAFAT